MEWKVCIRTPKGRANETLHDWKTKLIKKTLFCKTTVKEEYTNKAKNKLYWVIESDAKQYLKAQRDTGQYNAIVSNFFNHHLINKAIKRMADSPEDWKELQRLIEDGTRVEIIKEATAQEMVEVNKTFWEKVKETFVKT